MNIRVLITLSLMIAAVTLSAFGCVKRAPRTPQDQPPPQDRKQERCGLSCQIKKKWNEENRRTPSQSDQRRDRQDRDRPRDDSNRDTIPRDAPVHRGEGVYHTVKKGETLYRICQAYDVPMEEVCRANHIDDPSKLSVGQRLWIPGRSSVRNVPVPDQPPPGRTPPPSAMKGTLLFPVPGGKISSRYGPRGDRMHEGLDILAPEGTPVLAADDGKVVYADDTIRGYGNMIIVKHAGNISTVYAHNSRNLVKNGDIVKRGQKIAEVGMTGRASAFHLHFEVRVGEKPVDPELYLE